MKFPFPMFLTTWHMVFNTIITQVMSRTTNMLPAVKEVNYDLFVVVTIKLSIQTYTFMTLFFQQKKVDMAAVWSQILPVSICFAISLVLSNKSYIYLSVSYIQVNSKFVVEILPLQLISIVFAYLQ